MPSSRACSALTDEQFPEKTRELKARFAAGTPLDDLVPEAFALVREASRRKLGLAPFRRAADRRPRAARRQDRRDAHRRGQDLDGHPAGVSERAHRRGRARRHGQRIPGAARLGLDGPGVPLSRHRGRRHQERPVLRTRSAPPTPATSPTAPTTNSASTTCATIWRFVSRTACSASCRFAIVDEVDSILIDEARTPLIISGPAEESTELYIKINTLIPRLDAAEGRERPGRLRRRREDQAGDAHRRRPSERSRN